MSLLAAAIAVLVGFAFAFGMRVGQVAYWAALRFAGTEGGTAKAAKTVGIACGIALVLFLLGSGFAHQRKSKSKQ